jgi:phage I-like protein
MILSAPSPVPSPARPSALAVAALAAQIELAGGAVPSAVQLLPAGAFRASDGRPADAAAWVLDAATAQRLIEQVAARKNPLPIDYEHQTVHARSNGQPAPAAGWFSRLEWREGSGLWAVDVRWTERARQMIAAGEYRYLSPVFLYDRRTGAVTRLLHAALTNDPALDGMAAVAAARQLDPSTDPLDTETPDMELTTLVAACASALGQSTLAPEQLAPAVAALKAEADTARAAAEQAQAELKKEREALAALKASTQPAEVMAQLKADLAALTAEVNARRIDDLVKPALADGRLLPAQEAWARELGATNLAALSKYLDTAQPIAALVSVQTAHTQPGQKAPQLTDEQAALCRIAGWDAAVFTAAAQA